MRHIQEITQKLYILYEYAPGYALIDYVKLGETFSDPKNSTDMARFSQNIKLTAFAPFTHPEHALSAIQNVSTGVLGKDLQELLLTHLPPIKKDKTSNYQLGVTEPRIAAAIQNKFKISCVCSALVDQLIRAIRLHFHKFIEISIDDLEKAQLALAHAYSRSQVKFDVNRTDNMVKQAIFLYDQLEKDINMLAMRVKK
ncbi:MAG: putative nucleolar protein 56 [Streblomastix strix]|uniref:Putative nucleolar protein 56 n=1 Tax=Streblomastix strix TaxID=222440 RepID=A0A5J4UY75_9EUKA|nr:MAG: putative nucleolar protein 56 [Streblomastix strix]